MTAYEKGYHAFLKGEKMNQNPYTVGSWAFFKWEEGFCDASCENDI